MASSSAPYAGQIVPAGTPTSSGARIPTIVPGGAMNPQIPNQIPTYTPSTVNVTLTPGQIAALQQLSNQAGVSSSQLTVPSVAATPNPSTKGALAMKPMAQSTRAASLPGGPGAGAQSVTQGQAGAASSAGVQ